MWYSLLSLCAYFVSGGAFFFLSLIAAKSLTKLEPLIGGTAFLIVLVVLSFAFLAVLAIEPDSRSRLYEAITSHYILLVCLLAVWAGFGSVTFGLLIGRIRHLAGDGAPLALLALLIALLAYFFYLDRRAGRKVFGRRSSDSGGKIG